MTEARKLAMQSAFLRKLAAMEEARTAGRGCDDASADADIDSDAGGYECEFGDGEDSGYTEIPMTDAAGGARCGAGGGASGLRERVARFVFRSPQPQQPPPPPPPPPLPPVHAPASAQSRRRRSPAEFAGYAYTRWAYQPAAEAARSRPTQPATPPPLTKSVSARTVRFCCPYDEAAPTAEVTDSTLIRPYSTSAFACPPAPPPMLPPPGERSTSSGYGSDMDAGPAASPGDHWAVREEDIDRLLFTGRGRQPAAAQRLSPRQQLALPGDASGDDLDVGSLDLTAIFPAASRQAPPMSAAADASAGQIDRIVGDVVRLKGAAAAATAAAGRSLGRCQTPPVAANQRGGIGGSPWRQQRREFVTAASSTFGHPSGPASASAYASDCLELAELRPAARSYGLANYCQ